MSYTHSTQPNPGTPSTATSTGTPTETTTPSPEPTPSPTLSPGPGPGLPSGFPRAWEVVTPRLPSGELDHTTPSRYEWWPLEAVTTDPPANMPYAKLLRNHWWIVLAPLASRTHSLVLMFRPEPHRPIQCQSSSSSTPPTSPAYPDPSSASDDPHAVPPRLSAMAFSTYDIASAVADSMVPSAGMAVSSVTLLKIPLALAPYDPREN